MRKLILAATAIAALATTAVTMPSPAEARNGGRNAAIGFGLAAGALGAAAAANSYYGPGYGYYAPPPRVHYYDNGPYGYDAPRVHYHRNYDTYYGW